MKKIVFGLITLFLIAALALSVVPNVEALQRVKGYTKKNGTYIAPHYKQSPNKSKFDNFSTKGNVNPYTGKKGTVNPFKIKTKR